MKKTSPPSPRKVSPPSFRREKHANDDFSFKSFHLPEDWVSTRKYSDEDIGAITKFIKEKLNYKVVDVFRKQFGSEQDRNRILTAILVQHYSRHPIRNTMPVQYKTKDPYLLAILSDPPARRAYKKVSPVSFITSALEDEIQAPFERAHPGVPSEFAGLQMIVGDILKQAFTHWDFFSLSHQQDADAFNELHVKLVLSISRCYREVMHEITKKSMKDTVEKRDISRFLSLENEFSSPLLFYSIESFIIDYLCELTFHGFSDKARVIHQLLMSIKSISYLSVTEQSDREKMMIYIAPSFISGLNLGAAINDGSNVYVFFAAFCSLTVKNSLFSFDYDQNAYQLLYRLKHNAFNGQNIIPDLALRDGSSPIREALRESYIRLAENGTQAQITDLEDKFYSHFVYIIGSYAKYYGLEKAEQAHSVLCCLSKMYLVDASPKKDETYGRVLRHLFDLPVTHFEFDVSFDRIAAAAVLTRFTQSFHPDFYRFTITPKEFSDNYLAAQLTINELLVAHNKKDIQIEQLTNDLRMKQGTLDESKLQVAKLTTQLEELTISSSPKAHRGLHFLHGSKAEKTGAPPKLVAESRSKSEHNIKSSYRPE